MECCRVSPRAFIRFLLPAHFPFTVSGADRSAIVQSDDSACSLKSLGIRRSAARSGPGRKGIFGASWADAIRGCHGGKVGKMTLRSDLDAAISGVASEWQTSRVQSGSTDVPDPAKMGYSEGKLIQATYLYTDMMDSSGLVRQASQSEVASIISAVITMVVRIMRDADGHIRSFDGDRVMGIFGGPDRQSRAVRAAMRINYAVDTELNAKIQSTFDSVASAGWSLRTMSGIASGEALLVRAGIRNNSDMISVGAAPNMAAKLSDLRDSSTHRIAVGKATHDALDKSTRVGSDGKDMWVGAYNLSMGGGSYPYFRSNYHMKIR